jgi:LmbE family N-acetylglucosaminyl deacetylase
MKVLAIGAHFDDVELGCGGSLWKHQKNNDDLYILVITQSDYYSEETHHKRTKEEALEEGKNAAFLIKAQLIIGNFKPLELTASKELINYLCRIISEVKPDVVYTHFAGDQHLDHKAIGEASLIATRTVNQVYAYISNVYETLPVFSPNCFVDISDEFEHKIQLVECYQSEKKTHPRWREQLTYFNGIYGIKNRADYVEPFQVIRILK